MKLKLLKKEYCLEEDGQFTLKVRITPEGETGTLTGTVTNKNEITTDLPWAFTITDNTKQKPTTDLSKLTFVVGNSKTIGLTIGKHTLTVDINGTKQSVDFSIVPITVKRIKDQYLLGIELEAQSKLVFQQKLRSISGVELLEVSSDTTVGEKELVYNFANKTLQWDNGRPLVITDEDDEYRLTDYLIETGIMDGNYITIRVEDIDDLPQSDQTELVIVDIFRWSQDDFMKCISDAHDYVCNSEIWTQLYPDYYSHDRKDNAIHLEVSDMQPSSLSVSRFERFELAVNLLIELVELKIHPYANFTSIIDLEWTEWKPDGRVEVRGYSISAAGQGHSSLYSGQWDKTFRADFRRGQRNKVRNYWQAKAIAGINDSQLRTTCIDVIAKIALLNMYIWAASGKDQGIASRSFSASGVSSSYTTTSSAEYGVYSANIAEVSKYLGVGNVTADQKKNGLLGKLKTQIEGGAFSFKL